MAQRSNYPSGSRQPGSPVSLKSAHARDDADARRVLADVGAANSPPAADEKGFSVQGKRWLHIVISLPDAGTSITWRLWTWDNVSELWCLDTRPGIGGTVSLAVADADNPQRSIIEVAGLDRVYLEIVTATGTFTNGLNAWLASNGEVDGG
jgi:hypothetical protein